MSRVVVLDSGPVGLATNPLRSSSNTDCANWIQALIGAGVRVVLPEIADYEVRRELLRAKKDKGIERLNGLAASVEYLPLTTAAMRQAALFWAQVRAQGKPTTGDQALDGDAILAAQAVSMGVQNLVIATTNPRHLSRFVPAEFWDRVTSL